MHRKRLPPNQGRPRQNRIGRAHPMPNILLPPNRRKRLPPVRETGGRLRRRRSPRPRRRQELKHQEHSPSRRREHVRKRRHPSLQHRKPLRRRRLGRHKAAHRPRLHAERAGSVVPVTPMIGVDVGHAAQSRKRPRHLRQVRPIRRRLKELRRQRRLLAIAPSRWEIHRSIRLALRVPIHRVREPLRHRRLPRIRSRHARRPLSIPYREEGNRCRIFVVSAARRRKAIGPSSRSPAAPSSGRVTARSFDVTKLIASGSMPAMCEPNGAVASYRPSRCVPMARRSSRSPMTMGA